MREITSSVTFGVLSRSLVRDILGTLTVSKARPVRKLSNIYDGIDATTMQSQANLILFRFLIECDHGLCEVQRSLSVSGGLYPIATTGT